MKPKTYNGKLIPMLESIAKSTGLWDSIPDPKLRDYTMINIYTSSWPKGKSAIESDYCDRVHAKLWQTVGDVGGTSTSKAAKLPDPSLKNT